MNVSDILRGFVAYWKSPEATKVGPFSLRLYWGKRGPSVSVRLARWDRR
jgi:hypothetical protein